MIAPAQSSCCSRLIGLSEALLVPNEDKKKSSFACKKMESDGVRLAQTDGQRRANIKTVYQDDAPKSRWMV